MLNRLVAFFKKIFDFFRATEDEFDMQVRDLGIIGKEFDELYEKLILAEDDLRDIANKYTIGEPDVKMIDVDESFSHMKKTMKDVRELAVEARNNKES